MLSIRLSRIGKKAQPSFRIIVQDKRISPKRDALEILGSYQPARQPKQITINKERISYWVSVGATPSDTVASLLKKEGMPNMDKFIVEPRNRQRKKSGEAAAAPAAPAAPAAAA